MVSAMVSEPGSDAIAAQLYELLFGEVGMSSTGSAKESLGCDFLNGPS